MSPTLLPGLLVDRQIQAAIQAGLLKISEYDPHQIKSASFDFRIGPAAVVTTATKPLDLRQQPLVLEPYAAALVLVEEIIELSGQVLGRLGPHSNLFKRGIFASVGPQIDPGYKGRMRVSLLNMGEHPVLFRHKTPFLTAEFVLLAEPPIKPYSGSPGEADLTEEEINQILSRGGPTLKDIHRDFLELHQAINDAATLGRAMPGIIDTQQSVIRNMTNVTEYLKGISISRLGPVPLTILEPGRYELTQYIPVVIQPSDDGFTATFFDANIATGGDTEQEAVDNLRSLIIDTFEMLDSEPVERLGPEPSRQLKVLRSLIRRSRDAH